MTNRQRLRRSIRNSDTQMGGPKVRLPTTCWSEILALGSASNSSYIDTVNSLIRKYWKPVYCYFRRNNFSNEDAKDLTQSFFLERDVFRRANPSRGRFRAFLFSCLDNFKRNYQRAAHAKRRCPPGGIISIEDLPQDEGIPFEMYENKTPEDGFNCDWVATLVRHVLDQFRKECSSTNKQIHYELFHERIVRPAFEGVEPQPIEEIADDLGLTPKQASNRLLTARRAFQRLLREEIRTYTATDEETAMEVRDVFAYFVSRD